VLCADCPESFAPMSAPMSASQTYERPALREAFAAFQQIRRWRMHL
jgi:hypothetical protein